MPSTAKLLTAVGSKVHAHRPDSNMTLCGLEVVDPASYDDKPPFRSADSTGKRFYNGRHRLMCDRCCMRAFRVRTVGAGEASFPLAKIIDIAVRR